jgi:hypothetical protein
VGARGARCLVRLVANAFVTNGVVASPRRVLAGHRYRLASLVRLTLDQGNHWLIGADDVAAAGAPKLLDW